MVARGRRWIGVDIGSASIKVAVLEPGAHGPRLAKSLIQELPLDDGGTPVDCAGWLQTVLQACEPGAAHVNLSGDAVAVRRIAVPPMSSAELPEAVKWQVKDQLPFAVQDAAIAFAVLGEVWEKDLRKADVLVAAATRERLQARDQQIRQAGRTTASVVPTPFALWSAVRALVPESRTGSIAVVEFGARTTQVAIGRQGQLQLVRELPLGTQHVTDALIGLSTSDRGTLIADRGQAEALTRQHGIVTEQATGSTAEGIPLFHAASLMRPVLEQALTEISRLLDFYKVQTDAPGIARIVLCGGGACVKHLAEYLHEGLGVPVEVFHPAARLSGSAPLGAQHSLTSGSVGGDKAAGAEAGEEDARLATAIGLALNHGEQLDLCAPVGAAAASGSWERQIGRWKPLAIMVAAVAFGALALLQGLSWIQQVRLAALQREWAPLESAYTQAMAARASERSAQQAAEQVEQLAVQEPLWDGVFKSLSALTPASIVLTDLRIEAEPSSALRRLRIAGVATDDGAAAHQAISTFMSSLERSAFVDQIELVQSTASDAAEAGSTTRFELSGALE